MKRRLLTVGLMMCSLAVSQAQQFHISEYDGDSVTIEYPPSFDGAYLFIEQSSNLAAQAWETVDYTQINLVEGAPVTYSAAAAEPLPDGTTTNEPYEIPYVMTPEYIMAVANGEIENEAWTANSVWQTTKDGASGFFRILGLSFVDTDGDGIDNVTEYANGTDSNMPDAPPVQLPPDDGDPQLVPGSVNSAPGDWNTPPITVYRNNGSAWQIINALTLALDGTNGMFTAQTTPDSMGNWIASRCNGTWQAPASGFTFPTVDGGSFYRTESASFQWQGMEKIYPLAMTAYDGSEQFINHLVQSNATDTAGLAVLENGTPVLVDASNPWTEEKVIACLKHLKTVKCRLQKVSGSAFDATDTTAMARGYEQRDQDPVTPKATLRMPINLIELTYMLDGNVNWVLNSRFIYVRNMKFEFLDSLTAHGFGETKFAGYVGIETPFDWRWDGNGYEQKLIQPSLTNVVFPGAITKTFHASAGDEVWFVAGATNHNELIYRDVDYPSGIPHAALYTNYRRESGYFPYDYDVLATLDLPPAAGQTLVMDSDRDGIISTNDLGRVDESHPYRFWVNEDGNDAEFDEADMEDFFPAMLVAPPDTSNVTFKLSADIDLDYIQTTMTSSNSQEYLHDIDLAQTLAGQIQTLSTGNQTPIMFSTNEVVLLAASEVNTNAHIMVHVLENGSETAVLTNYLSFTSITNMYRIRNFRHEGVSATDKPTNWPDELTNGKDLVYVHGFNVKDEFDPADLDPDIDTPARMWHRNIFKRLWFAGSNAKYHGVIWDGIGKGSLATHFQNSVVNAFATAPWLKSYLDTLTSSETVILGHSLGNMVVSSAICDYGASVSQYYALDAAVGLEAYGDVAPNAAFVPDNVFTWETVGFLDYNTYGWTNYPHETWASEWYRLFPETDKRSELTFRHKFGRIQEHTDVFNFYSSTEDILGVRPDIHNILQLIDWSSISLDLRFHLLPVEAKFDTPCAWQFQEMYKGLNNWVAGYSGGGSSKFTGWGFTQDEGEHLRIARIKKPMSHPPAFESKRYAEKPFEAEQALNTEPDNAAQRSDYLETLKTDPLFRREPEILFGDQAASFVGGIVGDYESVLDYDNGELLGGPDIDVSDVKIRDWLLAKGFPSRTGPMGSSPVDPRISVAWEDVSFDMFTQFRTNPSKWPIENSDQHQIWRHSDWKNVPYVHVYKLFEKMTGKED